MAIPTAKTIPGRNATAGIAFTFAAAPTVATAIDWMPGDILIAHNSGASPRAITIVSNPKAKRATTTITAESIAAGAYRVFPRFGPQDLNQLTISADNAEVLFARISTKAQPA